MKNNHVKAIFTSIFIMCFFFLKKSISLSDQTAMPCYTTTVYYFGVILVFSAACQPIPCKSQLWAFFRCFLTNMEYKYTIGIQRTSHLKRACQRPRNQYTAIRCMFLTTLFLSVSDFADLKPWVLLSVVTRGDPNK